MCIIIIIIIIIIISIIIIIIIIILVLPKNNKYELIKIISSNDLNKLIEKSCSPGSYCYVKAPKSRYPNNLWDNSPLQVSVVCRNALGGMQYL